LLLVFGILLLLLKVFSFGFPTNNPRSDDQSATTCNVGIHIVSKHGESLSLSKTHSAGDVLRIMPEHGESLFLPKTRSAGDVLRTMSKYGELLSLPKACSAGEVLRIGSTFVDGDIPSDPIVILLACALGDHFASSSARGMQVRTGIPKPYVRAPV
jgi:hypothetical protein